MKVPDDFKVSLVASEPDIRQPLSISFDDRGRMWVIQYLQYPAPAGLKAVKVDPYLRTTYDRVPEPPPRGPKGADRITICEDTDRDGKVDKFKDFVADLNLCSGMALGYGGVFVMQPPYLLFYADRNRDDIPDGPPEVLLSGFGMEDAHALANSLTWGPDGWLYGAEGSTVTSKIRDIEFQQGIWRYHPVTHEFELFAEGGGNTWGLDFDETGEILAGTNFEDKMLHQVQGAYYLKNFGKHGELHNPHAYGYFGHVPYTGYRGKHISAGGISYQGGAFPQPFSGAYIFANTLDNAVYWATLRADGSSFTASFGGALLKTDDIAFRPVDCESGPDGAVYICDWYDKRATHVDPLDTWDKTTGRIYRVQSRSAPAVAAFDLQRLSSGRLADLLSSPNDWFVRRARCLLAERKDASLWPRLRHQVFEAGNSRLQLQSFFALHCMGGVDDGMATEAARHPNPNIRKWAVRFLGDRRAISGAIAEELRLVAREETNATVRAQVACSAKRFPGEQAIPILHELLLHSEDAADRQIPLLTWWGIEQHTISSRREVMEVFRDPRIWESALVQKHILERLSRRYASEGKERDFESCAALLEEAGRQAGDGKKDMTPILLRGMEEGLAGRALGSMPAALEGWFGAHAGERRPEFIRVAVRLGSDRARSAAWQKIEDASVPENERVLLMEAIGAARRAEAAPRFLALLSKWRAENIQVGAIAGLQAFPEPDIATKLLEVFPKLTAKARQRAIEALTTRPAWAGVLIGAVEDGRIKPGEVGMGQVRQMASYENAELARRLEKLWGKVHGGTPVEKQNRINELKLVLKPSGVAGREPTANRAAGKKLFQQSCGICHKLFGEGNSIGPDLTSIDRKNTEYLLQSIVDPSAYIRNEYVSFEITTRDQQTLSGLLAESGPAAVTVVSANNERHVVAREQIREMKESSLSLMPEGLLDAMEPQQVIDLFGYLQSPE